MKAFESSNLSTSAFATPKPERAEAGFAWLRRDTVRLQKSEVLQRDEVGSNAKICFMYKAFEFEKYLKTGSGRAFIKKHF